MSSQQSVVQQVSDIWVAHMALLNKLTIWTVWLSTMLQLLPSVSPGSFMWGLVVVSLFQTALLVYNTLFTLSLEVKYIRQKKQSHAEQVRLLQPNYVHHWTDTTHSLSVIILCRIHLNLLEKYAHPNAAPIHCLLLLEVSMRLCARFTKQSWMNLVIKASQRLLTLGSPHQNISSSRSVMLQIQSRLTLMSFLGCKGVWGSWRIQLLRLSPIIQVSILLILFLMCVVAFWRVDSVLSTGPAVEVWRNFNNDIWLLWAVTLRLGYCTGTGSIWRWLWMPWDSTAVTDWDYLSMI